MRTQITFTASIAMLAVLTACTKERLEPMSAVPEARTAAMVSKPLIASDKHALRPRVYTDAAVVTRVDGQVTGSYAHDIAIATTIDRTTVNAVGSHFPVITFFDGDRATGRVTGSNGYGGGVVPAQSASSNGVCSYCWQTGLAAYPPQMPIRLLESDDPITPAPRVHISGEFLPVHANTPTTVIGPIGREIPENEAIIQNTPTVGGAVIAVSISDDGGKDE